ncbi:uncharacterized protein PAC_00338 [Phialocephala subalpina]|uniref:Uncharacterized protein n=1 Tax=Phialocephala subalpina TaxID=576137 RepID=A0A1L7WCF2_9HELO|nr:uncharacterized protein PAC_00338 [Phialocephala subalpina]
MSCLDLDECMTGDYPSAVFNIDADDLIEYKFDLYGYEDGAERRSTYVEPNALCVSARDCTETLLDFQKCADPSWQLWSFAWPAEGIWCCPGWNGVQSQGGGFGSQRPNGGDDFCQKTAGQTSIALSSSATHQNRPTGVSLRVSRTAALVLTLQQSQPPSVVSTDVAGGLLYTTAKSTASFATALTAVRGPFSHFEYTDVGYVLSSKHFEYTDVGHGLI